MKDLYKILEIDKNATADEIKTAYRRSARKWHPDVNKSPEAKEKFQEVNEAYQILSDPDKKRQYDSPPQQRNSHTSAHFYDDPFAFDLNAVFRQAAKTSVYQVLISLEEAYNGVSKVVNGKHFTLPRGIKDHTTFRIGDDLISIRIMPHDKFKFVSGMDLSAVLNINVFDAMLGTKAIINHLDGSKLEVIIPPGVKQGQALRLPNKGMILGDGSSVGDLYILVNLDMPKLTEEQRNAIMSVHTVNQPEI